MLNLTKSYFNEGYLMRKFVLVIGSKPDSLLPYIAPEHVYTANAALALTKHYLSKGIIDITMITLVTTGHQLRNDNVKAAFRDVLPGRLYSRRHCVENQIKQIAPHTKFVQLTNQEQYDFQKNFLGRKLITAQILTFIYLLKVKGGIKFILKRSMKLIQNKPVTGVSTGLYAILLAAYEFPHHNILVTGVGLSSGGHFDNELVQFGEIRSRLDYQFAKSFPKTLLDRLYTTDRHFSKVTGAKLYKS